MKLRALKRLSWRTKTGWKTVQAGEVFTPPSHVRFAPGSVEEVTDV